MIRKLLFHQQDKKQVLLAIIGAFLGMTFLLTSIHYLIKVNQFGQGEEILGPNTLIVQKKVSSLSTLNLKRSDFTPAELKRLREESCIENVEPIINNAFNVSLRANDPSIPYFRTDVFLQSLDERFLDAKVQKWSWSKKDSIVPVIMPREFIVMMNTFMAAKGMPKISDELVMSIKFDFWLANEDKSQKGEVKCKIVGFTNEVSSLLVPESFMNYANKLYAPNKTVKAEQIMLSGKENQFGKVEEIMKMRGYEAKKSQGDISRLKSIASTLILVVMGISILAVLLAGLVLIQYLQLLIGKNQYEVRTLLRLGHDPKTIIQSFLIYFSKVFGIIALLSLVLFILLKFLLDNMFTGGGIYIDTGLTFFSIFALFLAYTLFGISAYFSARKEVLATDPLH